MFLYLSYTVHTHLYWFLWFRFVPVTVSGFQVTEGKAKELNFTLSTLSDEGASHKTTLSTIPPTTPVTNSSNSRISPSMPSDNSKGPDVPSITTAPTPQPQQPHEFRHHHNSDMDVFLQKFHIKYPSITRLYSIGKSVQSRFLWVMEISDNPGEHEQGAASRLFFIFFLRSNFKYDYCVRSLLSIKMIHCFL